jgi:hypothetical protein
MSCLICGPVCRCVPETDTGYHGAGAVEARSGSRLGDPDLIDPEAYDASEQQFDASLEESSSQMHVQASPEEVQADAHAETVSTTLPEPSIFQGYQDPAAWKQELATKLNEYRRRHQPRAPRYPSLQLKFEVTEPAWSTPVPQEQASATFASRESTALDRAEIIPSPEPEAPRPPSSGVEGGGRLLEFPRAAAVPQSWVDELAEPVMDLPRILDVPDTAPPPPALGGISIEPLAVPEDEKRLGIEIPMLTAPMGRRVLAGMVDAALVGSAIALSGYIFFQIAGLVPLRPAAMGLTLLGVFFWFGYQYLLVVHSGTTPGLKLAGLELSRFDGSAVAKQMRRWRMLASLLSGASLGLGYAWCFLDEDQLCWHDRITRTYAAPKP